MNSNNVQPDNFLSVMLNSLQNLTNNSNNKIEVPESDSDSDSDEKPMNNNELMSNIFNNFSSLLQNVSSKNINSDIL